MAVQTAPDPREEVRRRLREDYLYYPPRALKIKTKQGEVIPFVLKRPQARLNRMLLEQRAAGEPQRAVILKARQIGMSTDAQGLLIQRATQRQYHFAMVVAQDRLTAAALFDIGRFMWANLPAQIRPQLAFERNSLDQKLLHFGESAQNQRRQGIMGLESQIQIATARVAAGGRGMTIHSLHLSESAWWERTDKRLGLLQAVPDDPDSLALEESTANGHNHFKDTWDGAEAGESGWLAFFSPWFEEDAYRRPFAGDDDRAAFEARLGHDRIGEDEPMLLELIDGELRRWAAEDGLEVSDEEIRTRVLEHLHWRRWAIGAKTEHSVEKFHQEYPSTPEEAFLSTGRRVFAPEFVLPVLKAADVTDPVIPTDEKPGPALGDIRGADERPVRARAHTTVLLPRRGIWLPRSRIPGEPSPWRLWELPVKARVEPDGTRVPDGQYIVSCDPASGEEDEKGTVHAEHGVQIIDHRTLRQVAEYRSQIDPDELARVLYAAALFYNEAWVVVESTGGYGLSINRALARIFRYPRVFEDESRDKRVEDRTERLGFHTDAVSKPLLEARAIELVREGTHGIRSRVLARQALTYIRDKRGRTKPEAGKLSDLLMAWMIGQYVATLRPVRPERKRGATSTSARTVRSRKAGW
jgi:hypothetical protein